MIAFAEPTKHWIGIDTNAVLHHFDGILDNLYVEKNADSY